MWRETHGLSPSRVKHREGSRGSLRGKANASLEAEVASVVQESSWKQHSVLCLFPVMKCRLGSRAGLALGPYWKHPGVFLSDRLGLLTSFSLGIKGTGTVRCMWCVPQLVTLLHRLCTPGETGGGCYCLQKQAEVGQDSLTMPLPGCLSRGASSPPRGERQGGGGEGGRRPRAGS